MTLRVGSMFSGYGGLDMAVGSVLDAEPAWFVEFDDGPSRILAHHWPGVPNFGDVTQVDWSTVPPVDVLTGGYPCQPFSAAGRREGTNDERHLWPYVRAAIRVLRPRFAFLENVAGHRSLGFDRVLGDLAEDGADVWWTSVRASDGGAPHHRERVFILVVPADPDGLGLETGQQPEPGSAKIPGAYRGVGALPDTEDNRRERPRTARDRGAGPADGSREAIEWGAYAPAVHRWERVVGPAPAPTELNTNGKPRLNAAFAEWMMGLPPGHVTGVPGLSRAAQLKAIGNGVCPQQGAAALSELLSLATLPGGVSF